MPKSKKFWTLVSSWSWKLSVGVDISLEQLRARHTALYLGIGAQMGRPLGLPGEEGPSVWTGTDYLSTIELRRGN